MGLVESLAALKRSSVPVAWALAALLGCGSLRDSVLGLSRTSTGTEARFRTELGYRGVPGIIDVPVADAISPGHVAMAANTKRDLEGQSGVGDVQRSMSIALGLFPFLSLSARGVLAEKLAGAPRRDVAPNLQLLLLDEGSLWPSVALGATDFAGGAAHYASQYAVASKTWFALARTSVGYRRGSSVQAGWLLGLELSPSPYFSLLAEHDGRDAGLGLRLFPMPAFLERYGFPRPSADVSWTEESGFAGQVGLSVGLGESKYVEQREARRGVRFVASSTASDPREACLRLWSRLVDQGFEGVRVQLVRTGTAALGVRVELEDRRYPRDPMHGLGIALAIAALELPDRVDAISLTLRRLSLDLMTIEVRRSAFLELLDEELPVELFAEGVDVYSGPGPTWPVELETERSAGPAFRVDVTVVPKVETLILAEESILETRLSIFPDARAQLWPGLTLAAQLELELTNTSWYFGPPVPPNLYRLMASQVIPVLFGREVSGHVAIMLGKYEREVFGAGAELTATILGGALLFRVAGARLGSELGSFEHWYAVAEARALVMPLDLALDLRAGRFIDDSPTVRDPSQPRRLDAGPWSTQEGVRLELYRMFGSTEVGLFGYAGLSKVAGLTVRIPLSLPEELRPFWIRPRLPELGRFAVQSTILETANVIRPGIGRALAIDAELPQSFFLRDRAHPAYVKAHLEALRDAARTWVAPEDIVE
ncbi:MAG: YjbH domain-containing protein [Deltaproteobacteria bacterium]|nr:YjbH domain-containing protein [Deltaproteobacteria bacterium]